MIGQWQAGTGDVILREVCNLLKGLLSITITLYIMKYFKMEMGCIVVFELCIRVHRIFFLFDFYSARTFFFVFFNSKNNLFSYIF